MECQVCGTVLEYSGRGRPRKYCLDCAYIVHLKQKRNRMRRKRFLGMSSLWEHPKSDFNLEYIKIQEEFKRLNLKKDKLYIK